ncbi:FlgD immunoglobulin-like domain containing protein [Gracilimonas tropica]|uniref:FlgD immunoglobulin-like domain containing protein n=1 Tax=Gracilimonas tropica TaxID=454600 RepID=UPI000372BFFD|nr:FlgD immunoglobulin-like domain containing protein [Gracilimonas tropica]
MRYLITLFFILLPLSLIAQVLGPTNSQFNSIRQNGVSTIKAIGDTVWISPSLNRNIDNRPEWYTPENADSILTGIGRVFSIDLAKDTVVAGLGYTAEIENGSVPAAYGYYRSIDGGETWVFNDFLTDPKGDNDTTFVYGGQVYDRIRITVPQQSPPYAVDFEGDVLFSANWASGLLRSMDLGSTWERIILPPFSELELSPERDNYYWVTCTDRDDEGNCIESINKYNSVDDDNLKGFGVLVDSQQRVWFGSAGGINVSENALEAPIDSISWRHIRSDNTQDGLLGDWIISIKEEPGTGRIWMTNWIASSPQKQGIVFTEDGGQTFTQMLIGERINDIGFKDGYVFATGDNGLFISSNGGKTWIKSPQIKSPNTFIKPSAAYYTVAATTNRIWIGTDDGIASHQCCVQGQEFDDWQITRVDFPLKGGNIFAPDAKSVNSYAYPNPFSMDVHRIVRIKFEVQKQANVNVRIFDVGMNLVRELETDGSYSPGNYEAVWDGYDGKGRKVANGPYIYVVEMGNRQISGKILVVE